MRPIQLALIATDTTTTDARPIFRVSTRARTAPARRAARHCDGRCIYAKGPDCECHCNGKNHGKGFTFGLDTFIR
jgi:hypothetical protein